MSKKDYERAASILQGYNIEKYPEECCWENAVDAFVKFFRGDNRLFDEERFRAACVPGANVKARGR